jgi:hypothetical protein
MPTNSAVNLAAINFHSREVINNNMTANSNDISPVAAGADYRDIYKHIVRTTHCRSNVKFVYNPALHEDMNRVNCHFFSCRNDE